MTPGSDRPDGDAVGARAAGIGSAPDEGGRDLSSVVETARHVVEDKTAALSSATAPALHAVAEKTAAARHAAAEKTAPARQTVAQKTASARQAAVEKTAPARQAAAERIAPARQAAAEKTAELKGRAMAKLPDSSDGPPLAGRFGIGGPKPTVGVGVAGRTVAEDLSALVKAEIALAKAEFSIGAKAKAKGAGALTVAGVLAWLGVQGLLITLGFVLALFLPGWVAALIVTLLLLGGAAAAGLIGKKKLATPVSLDTTKANVEQDVTTTKTSLARP